MAGFYPQDTVTYIGLQVCTECHETTRYIAGSFHRYTSLTAEGETKATRAVRSQDSRFAYLPHHVETFAEVEHVICPACLALKPAWDIFFHGESDEWMQTPLPFVEKTQEDYRTSYKLTQERKASMEQRKIAKAEFLRTFIGPIKE